MWLVNLLEAFSGETTSQVASRTRNYRRQAVGLVS